MITAKKISQLASAFCLALSLQGCWFSTNVQQGNIMTDAEIAQLKQGMTSSEVKKILGTPVLEQNKSNILDEDDNDKDEDTIKYVYFYQSKYGKTIRKRVFLTFEDGKLTELNILT